MDMITNIFPNPYSVGFFVIFIANLVFAGFVYSRRRSNERAIFWFSFLILLSGGWALGQFGMSSATTAGPYAFWYALTELMVSPLMAVYVCFVLSFVGKAKVIERFDVVGFLVGSIAVLLFLYWKTDIITIHNFALAVKMPWGYEYPRGQIPCDLIMMGSYICYVLFELLSYYAKTKDSLKKRQIGLVTLALMLPSIGGIAFQGILPVVLRIPELPVTPPLILLTCLLTGYTLLKYGTEVFSFSEVSPDILQMIPDSLLALDSSFRIQTANPAAAKLLGVSAEELVGKSLESFLSTDAEKVFWRQNVFEPLTHRHEIESVETALHGPAGVSHAIKIHAITRSDQNGKVVSIIMLLTDISSIKSREQESLDTMKLQEEQNATLEDNKKAMLNLLEDSRTLEQDLKIERDRATAIVSSMSEGLFVVDKNFRVVLMNPMAEKIVGVATDKAVGQPLDKITVVFKRSQELKTSERPLKQTLDSGTPVSVGLEEEYYLKISDGRLVPISFSTAVLRRDGEIIGAIETFHDISRDKSVKETIEQTVEERTMQLKEEEARLTASINSLELGFILTDIEGGIMSKNPAASSILNLPWGIKGLKDIDEALHASFSFMALHNKARNDHKPTDKRNISLAGKFIDIFVAPIYVGGRDEDFIGSALLIQDQTEAKVLERSRDEFFSIASHELRTPLTAIRGNTSLIQEHYSDKLDPELKEMVNDIHDSSIRLIDIVNDFLNMGRLEQQRIDFKNESFVIEDLIAAALKEYEVTGSRQNLSLEFIAPPKPMPRVFADKDRIRQVLINLIGNSLKFTTMGGVKISVRENDGMVEVSIVDTGRGIALPNQALLFHKFQQAGDSLFTRDTTKGTGLGLYISKLMIEAMGGKIWLVRSEEGKGSEFAFTLPLAKAGAL